MFLLVSKTDRIFGEYGISQIFLLFPDVLPIFFIVFLVSQNFGFLSVVFIHFDLKVSFSLHLGFVSVTFLRGCCRVCYILGPY